jgi:glutamate/tyrosine decarboxylase-like PLP-dependent enzyme
VERVPTDDQGRMDASCLPRLDDRSLLILQAGNVNSGAFDPFEQICSAARRSGAWIHVDGAFGLWAAGSEHKRHLVKGVELADSWSVDAHKTLNTPYDCGLILCRHGQALVSAMQAHASYIHYSENRDNMLVTPDMSRRGRALELWATLKYLGKKGVQELVNNLCDNAVLLASMLKADGFRILNDVVFNQVLVACDTAGETQQTLAAIQASGECWCGGAVWKGNQVIRVSVCSWATTEADIKRTAAAFVKARELTGIIRSR